MNRSEIIEGLLYKLSQEVMTYHHHGDDEQKQDESMDIMTELAIKALRYLERTPNEKPNLKIV